MPYRENELTDPRALRAVAHPVRLALLEQLMINGAATASQLGDRIEESPANCSWHLRKLAEHGLVEEASGGRGRERPWQATSQGMTWDDSRGSSDQVLAGDALGRVLIERELARLSDSRRRVRDDSAAWQDASDVSQSLMWLTPEELGSINAQVRELFQRHLDRHEHPERRPEGARLCGLVQWGVPAYDVPVPEPVPDPRPRVEGE